METDGDITENGSGSGLSGMTVTHPDVAGSFWVSMLADLLPSDVYLAKITVKMDSASIASAGAANGVK